MPSAVTPWDGYDYTKVIYVYAPMTYTKTINITDIYNEGDTYNITINEGDIIVPEQPERTTKPSDMNVRPDEDMLKQAGVDPAPREEWDVDVSIGASYSSSTYDDESTTSSTEKATSTDKISSVSLSLSSGGRGGSAKRGGVSLTAVNRDAQGETTSAAFSYKWEIRNSSGSVVSSNSGTGSGSSTTISAGSSLAPGSYTAQISVRHTAGGAWIKSNAVSFNISDELDDESESTSSSSSESTTETTDESDSSGSESSSATTTAPDGSTGSSDTSGTNSSGTNSSGGYSDPTDSYDSGSSTSGGSGSSSGSGSTSSSGSSTSSEGTGSF